MVNRPATRSTSPHQPFQPRPSSSAPPQPTRSNAVTSPNAVPVRPTLVMHTLKENDAASKSSDPSDNPSTVSGLRYLAGDPMCHPLDGQMLRSHPGAKSLPNELPSVPPVTLCPAPVPEQHKQLVPNSDHDPHSASPIDQQNPFQKAPKASQSCLKNAGAKFIPHKQYPGRYTLIAPISNRSVSSSQHSTPSPARASVSQAMRVIDPRQASTQLVHQNHHHSYPQRSSYSSPGPSTHSRYPITEPLPVQRRRDPDDTPCRFNVPRVGSMSRSGNHRQMESPRGIKQGRQPSVNGSHQRHYNQPAQIIQVPPTKGVKNGTTKISADEAVSILPQNVRPPFNQRIRSPNTSTDDILAPFRSTEPSQLTSAPLPPGPQILLRSKAVDVIVDDRPPSSKPSTPSRLKDSIETSNARHPEVFANSDGVPDIPRKDRTTLKSSDGNLKPFSHSPGQLPHPRDIDRNQTALNSSQSPVSKPVNFNTSSPDSSLVNVEADVGQRLTARISKPFKRVGEGKATSKSEWSQNGAQKRSRCSQIFDLDSELGNENTDIVECGGGGEFKRTRTKCIADSGAFTKRIRKDQLSSSFEKVQGEAWMNHKYSKDQVLSALKDAFNEHPNIINLSHFSLSFSDLRNVLEMEDPPGCDGLDRAYELDNNRITGLNSHIWGLFAERKVDRLNLALNGMTKIEGHISVCKKLRFLNLSRNELKSLPDELAQLEALETINVSHNFLQRLPEKMLRLRKLEILSVAHNDLEGLPTDLVDCGSKLFAVDISYNAAIKVLPDCLKHCKELANLELAGTGLRNLLRLKESNDVFILTATVAGRSEEDLLYRKKEGTFPSVAVAPPSEKAGRAALEREESRKSALRSRETNEVQEVHTLDDV